MLLFIRIILLSLEELLKIFKSSGCGAIDTRLSTILLTISNDKEVQN